MRYVPPSERRLIGWDGADLDGVYPPAKRGTYRNGNMKIIKEAAQGAAALHHLTRNEIDWTILAFWDRSGDSRSGSNTAFILEGTHDYPAALKLAKETFPELFERFTFHVHHYQGEP